MKNEYLFIYRFNIKQANWDSCDEETHSVTKSQIVTIDGDNVFTSDIFTPYSLIKFLSTSGNSITIDTDIKEVTGYNGPAGLPSIKIKDASVLNVSDTNTIFIELDDSWMCDGPDMFILLEEFERCGYEVDIESKFNTSDPFVIKDNIIKYYLANFE